MKKIFAIALCVAMLAIVVVSGTMAYFTDNDSKTNIFTMGKVEIELEEPDYEPVDGKLKVFPGQSYAKNPTITVEEGSEDCYLVATVTISQRGNLHKLYENDTTGIKQDWGLSLAGKGGVVSGGVASYDVVRAGAEENGMFGNLLENDVFVTYDEVNDTIIYTFYFMEVQKVGDVNVLFETVNIPANIQNDTFEGDLNVSVSAYAIQTVGFNDVFEAYEAYLIQE